MRFASILILSIAGIAGSWPSDSVSADEQAALFESRIRPVLASTCFRCHGDTQISGGLRVDSREALLKGGESGSAITPGNAAESLLIRAIKRQAEVSAMPPENSRQLRADQVADLVKWVDDGAVWPATSARLVANKHWAFEPIRDVPPPVATAAAAWAKTSIDAYVFAPHGAARDLPTAAALRVSVGEQGPPASDRLAWIRRATFDLTGLPPTPDEVRDFQQDDSPQAFERVVDRLLHSPAYGERWARHWLDVVRYADTAGETADYPAPLAWKYRNYVINSFNADKPYDQFLREQIAGDILAREGPPESYAEQATATGFLAISRRFGFDSENYHHLTIQDTIDTLGQAVLGLSLGCARCHDHKFDPVSMRDYYALYGIFDSSRYPFPGSEQKQKFRTLLPAAPPGESQVKWREFDARVSQLTRQLEQLGRPAPAAILRSLDDYDGDFELQAVAAGGSRGVLVPPWLYDGLISVTNSAQSPFKNIYARGKVGAHVVGGTQYRMAQSLPVRRLASGGELHFSVDFRVPELNADARGRHRFWLGTRVAPPSAATARDDRPPPAGPQAPVAFADSPAVEIWIGADALYARSGEQWESLAPLKRDQWHQLQLSLDLAARTFTGRVATTGQSAEQASVIATRPLTATWAGAIDFIAFDARPELAQSAPAIDIDNLSVQGSPHLPASLAPPPSSGSVESDWAALQTRLETLIGADPEFEFQRENEPPTKPWNPGPNSVVKLAQRAQSPFRNMFAAGTLGLHMPNRGQYDGFGLTPPKPWKADTTERLFAAFDFRCADQAQGGDGSWRYYVGHGPGPSPAVELFFNAREFFQRSEGKTTPVCQLEVGRWYQVQLTLELAKRRYSGVVLSEGVRHPFAGRLAEGWDGTIDYSFIDSYGHQGGVRPALDVDNYVIRETPLPESLAPASGVDTRVAPGDAHTARRAEAIELRRRIDQQAGSADAVRRELDDLLVHGPLPLVYGMAEGTPHDAQLQRRGEPDQLGEVVPRGFLKALGGQRLSSESSGSGRMELARWITDPTNPLVARVMVNRLWQHHFGEGLVRTPNDFGLRGAAPSNPELLDHLATQFVRGGWSIKAMHRLIMLSAAYRQPAGANPASVRRRRLSAEEIRDSILAVTGELDRKPGAGHPFPPAITWGYTQHNPFIAVYEHDRRGIYLMTQRLKRHPFLALFDGPDPNASTAVRLGTTVPTQALYFLNDPFVHAKSERWATRLRNSEHESVGAEVAFHRATADVNAPANGGATASGVRDVNPVNAPPWLVAAFRQALGREPTAVERSEALEFLADYRAELDSLKLDRPDERAMGAYLRTLLASNAFLYVD